VKLESGKFLCGHFYFCFGAFWIKKMFSAPKKKQGQSNSHRILKTGKAKPSKSEGVPHLSQRIQSLNETIIFEVVNVLGVDRLQPPAEAKRLKPTINPRSNLKPRKNLNHPPITI
jgi:hypothetical protein